jgi:hypothetical protein
MHRENIKNLNWRAPTKEPTLTSACREYLSTLRVVASARKQELYAWNQGRMQVEAALDLLGEPMCDHDLGLSKWKGIDAFNASIATARARLADFDALNIPHQHQPLLAELKTSLAQFEATVQDMEEKRTRARQLISNYKMRRDESTTFELIARPIERAFSLHRLERILELANVRTVLLEIH